MMRCGSFRFEGIAVIRGGCIDMMRCGSFRFEGIAVIRGG